MKKDSVTHTSQDYDRKHKRDHIESNPRAAKDLPSTEDDTNEEDSKTVYAGQQAADLIAKGHNIANISSVKSAFTEDKRKTARHEHTNHFTNRAGEGNK